MSAATVSAWTGISDDARRNALARIVLLYLAIALAAALFLYPFIHVFSGAPDEGVYLYNAQRAAEGAIPGRDFLQENPPLAYYWIALFFKLFGTSFAVARGLLLATGVGTATVIFHLARRRGSSGISAALWVLVTSIPLMPINSPHYDSNFFALLGFCFFLFGADRLLKEEVHIGPFVVAGFLEGVTTCFLQQKGALFLLAFMVSLFLIHRKQSLKLCVVMIASFTGVLVLELVPYAIWGALADLFLSNVAMPLAGYHTLNHVSYGFPLWTVWFPAIFSTLRANASLILALPLLAITSVPFLLMVSFPVVIAALGYVWRSHAFGPKLLPYWITAYAMWLSELHRQDLSHLRNGCTLFVVLFFILCERCGTRVCKRIVWTVTLGTLLMGFNTLTGALQAGTPVLTRRGIMFARKSDRVLEFLLSHTRPGDYAFVVPYQPLYYFSANLRNPTRLSTIVDQRPNPLVLEAIRSLEAKKPRYALEDTKLMGDGLKTLFPAFEPPPFKERAIDRYLDAHYHQVALADGFRILERNAG